MITASASIQARLFSHDFFCSSFTGFHGRRLTIDGEEIEGECASRKRERERGVRDRDRANEERDGFHFAFHLYLVLVH